MRVMLVVHGFPPEARGGTEVYVRDLAIALAALPSIEIAVLTRHADPGRPQLEVRRRRAGTVTVFSINNTFQLCAGFAESYENPLLLRVAADLVDEFAPDVVHIEHLTCLSTQLPGEIARRGIPVVLTFNDYWLACHRGQLFDLDDARCDGPFDGGCARCIPAGALAGPKSYASGRFVRTLPVPGAAAAVDLAAKVVDRLRPSASTRAATEDRLRHMRESVAPVDRFLAPSETIAALFRRFGVPADRILRCNQGISLAGFEGQRRSSSDRLRVGFAGGLIPSKAPHILLDALDLLPPDSIIVDLLGGGGTYHGQQHYADALGPRLGHPAIRRLGPVPHRRMPAALHDVDVLVVPSVWIENAPFIIREAFAARAPVIASDLGGMAEMVKDGVDGLLFPPGDAVSLARCLRRLIEEDGLLDRLRAGIVRPMSIEAEAAHLRDMYGAMISRKPRQAQSRPTSVRPAAESIAAVVLNYKTADQTWLAVRSLQTSFTPPDRIFVVDNGSNDGSADSLRASLTGVDVVETGRNLGFSGGCNAGIVAALAADAGHVLLVNSDVVLAPDAIDYLLDALGSDPKLGIVAPLLLSRQEPGSIASAGINYSRHSGRMRQRASGRPVAALTAGPRGIESVSGCVMLIRRRVFELAGLLDEEYFFSFEDIDFCLRAADQGFRSACVEAAIAYHEGASTIGRQSPRRVYFATRNHLRLQSRLAAPGRRAISTAAVVGLNAAHVIISPEVRLPSGLAAVARGAWDHFRGRYGSD
jgi:GT2 family glycosyltransferase/glycosyltransferase involved in cell wall biosynthesis